MDEIQNRLEQMSSAERHEVIQFLEELEQVGKSPMDPPTDLGLPMFVYGALKPGSPAYEHIHRHVEKALQETTNGQIWVRDGLPLLRPSEPGEVHGCLIHWEVSGQDAGYSEVCAFEPRTHYKWEIIRCKSGERANALVDRFPTKANPLPHNSSLWRLSDDAAFGPAMNEIAAVLEDVESMDTGDVDSGLRRFFRAQMAYLLLWSVLERLAALSFGPGSDPMKRISRLHELEGVSEAVSKHVKRVGEKVADSRDPRKSIKLDANNAASSFKYYYQVRSNLSHRGKAAIEDSDRVESSLRELLAITRDYLSGLRAREMALS